MQTSTMSRLVEIETQKWTWSASLHIPVEAPGVALMSLTWLPDARAPSRAVIGDPLARNVRSCRRKQVEPSCHAVVRARSSECIRSFRSS